MVKATIFLSHDSDVEISRFKKSSIVNYLDVFNMILDQDYAKANLRSNESILFAFIV